MINKYIIILIVCAAGFSSCLKDKTVEPLPPVIEPCSDTVSFSSEILPELFNVSCNVSGCHSSEDAAAGYILTNHSEISGQADIVLRAIQHDPSLVPMPLGGEKLVDSLIQKFECWIDQGKLDN